MEHYDASQRELPRSELLGEQTLLACPRAGTETIWERLPPLRTDARRLALNRIVTTTSRPNPAHAAFDIIRTKLLQELTQHNWTTVGITSPTAGCGKTVVALNLAFSLANQKECRTILVDLDLKRPQLANTLGIEAPQPLARFLMGEIDIGDVFLRHGNNLAIGANKQTVSFSAELLQSRETVRVIEEMRQRMSPHVILFDMPPMLSNDDVLAFLPHVDCAILVAAAEQSTLDEVDVCEQELSERTNVLGVVLNKCRFSPEKYGY